MNEKISNKTKLTRRLIDSGLFLNLPIIKLQSTIKAGPQVSLCKSKNDCIEIVANEV